MDQRLYDKIKLNDPGGTAEEAANALSLVVDRVEKPIDERMISERGIYALLGMESGEKFLSAIEGSSEIPSRVKAWFKPSEKGVDVLNPAVSQTAAGLVIASVITQEDADKLTAFGYLETPAYPGVSPLMVQNARDQLDKGV